MKRRAVSLALTAIALLLPGFVLAQPYPEKPIRLIVPYPPGASTDAMGRLVGQKLGSAMGQTIVVDNRGGASGNIGTEAVARSAPDGYTFGLGTDATHASNYFMVDKPAFDPQKDFTPLALAAMNPIVLVVHPSVPANNLTELIAFVKANPNRTGYGSSGTGSPHHLAGELLKQRSGANFVHVPYRGGGPALNDLMGNQIPMLFASVITVLPHIKEGRLKAIGVTNATRYEGLPNVPTLAETVAGFDMPSWLAFFGPANMPAPVASRLSSELVKALQDPEVKAKLTAAGMVVVGSGPEELTAIQRRDAIMKGKLIRDVGIKAE